jgi:hypothetical protein
MPEKKTLQRARRAKRQGKAATTQAGAFVGEEMRHATSGKHAVKGRKQAIAIGLSKARRAGVKVPPKKGSTARSKPAARTRKAGGRSAARSRSASKPRTSSKRRAAAKSRSRSGRRSRSSR